MLADSVEIYRSANDVVLMPNTVEVKYTRYVQVLPDGMNIYRRPTTQVPRDTIACESCTIEWRVGMQFGPSCWAPLTG